MYKRKKIESRRGNRNLCELDMQNYAEKSIYFLKCNYKGGEIPNCEKQSNKDFGHKSLGHLKLIVQIISLSSSQSACNVYTLDAAGAH